MEEVKTAWRSPQKPAACCRGRKMRLLAATRSVVNVKWRQLNLLYSRRQVLIFVLLSLATSFLVWHAFTSYNKKMKVLMDSAMAMEWEGFGPERGLYNFTLVTMMFDIGRGHWEHQTRTYNTYLLYMQRVLRLDVSMVVYVDQKGKPFVDWMRRGRESRTHVVTMGFEDLPYFQLRDRMQEIMDSRDYRKDNELVQGHKCESYIPEYDILQLSKLYLMDRTAKENFFNTSYLIWMDGGYGHGKAIHPRDGVWVPQDLFEHRHQVTFIEREPGVEFYRGQEHRIHKLSINILAGLFFAGGAEVFKELYRMQMRLVEEWMRRGVVDDDQTMYMLLYYQKPSLFNLVPGGWDDVFRLFNKPKVGTAD